VNLRWHADFSFCNVAECHRAKECWRYNALIRLGEDQAKDIKLPRLVSIFRPDAETCDMFIEDEYQAVP
jgi:hypothetical protein